VQNVRRPEVGETATRGQRSETGSDRRPTTDYRQLFQSLCLYGRTSLHPEADRARFPAQMSTLAEIEEAAARLPSPDFVRLLEDLHDLATARVALGDLKENPTATIAWDDLKAELDALHG